MLYLLSSLVAVVQTNECVCSHQSISRHPALPMPGRRTPVTMSAWKRCLVSLLLVLMLNCLEAHRRQNAGRRGAMHMQMRCFDEHGHKTSCFGVKVSQHILYLRLARLQLQSKVSRRTFMHLPVLTCVPIPLFSRATSITVQLICSTGIRKREATHGMQHHSAMGRHLPAGMLHRQPPASCAGCSSLQDSQTLQWAMARRLQ
jgi:hypothetical protein